MHGCGYMFVYIVCGVRNISLSFSLALTLALPLYLYLLNPSLPTHIHTQLEDAGEECLLQDIVKSKKSSLQVIGAVTPTNRCVHVLLD